MLKPELDSIDRRLLDCLQSRFPLKARPFADIGQSLGLTEAEVIRRIRRLKETRIVRQIGPVLDATALGFQTTLAAMKVRSERLPEAHGVILSHPGISHGYEREHELNVWFTLAVPPGTELSAEAERIGRLCRADACFSLPALRVFKLNAYFGMGEDQPEAAEPPTSRTAPAPVALSETEKKSVNLLQRDLPLVPAAFEGIAAEAGLTVEQLLAVCSKLKAKRVLRRFGAAINHRQAGFNANAMTCWAVPVEKVDALGKRLAGLPQVSHCYQRAVNPAWRYNVFAMVHGHDKDTCREVVESVSRETGYADCLMLYSTREIEKDQDKIYGMNSYYPVFLSIKGRRCLVVGGGEVAARKVASLLDCQASVTLISPEVCPDLARLGHDGRVKIEQREFREGDLSGAFLAIAATSDSAVNRHVARAGAKAGVMVNIVDVIEGSDFIVPASLKRGDITIAVSTGGASPALARKIKSQLETTFGGEYGILADLVGEVRSALLESGIHVDPEDWQKALDLDDLRELIRQDRRAEARARLYNDLKAAAKIS